MNIEKFEIELENMRKGLKFGDVFLPEIKEALLLDDKILNVFAKSFTFSSPKKAWKWLNKKVLKMDNEHQEMFHRINTWNNGLATGFINEENIDLMIDVFNKRNAERNAFIDTSNEVMH